MKKIFAGLSVAALLVSGILTGLAVVPHSHGQDLDHSQHKTCPIYQKSFHSSDGAAETAPLLFAFIVCAALVFLSPQPRLARVRSSFASRAPPCFFSLTIR